MKVIFTPDYRNNNLYQTNLSDSLSSQGVFVNFGGPMECILKYWKPDILHIHWTYPFLIADSKIMTLIKSTRFICLLFLLKLIGIKIIWTVHNITDHEEKFKSLELLFNKFLVRLCDRLIVHCPSAKTELGNGGKIIVIPHGNYIGHYKNTMTYSEARNKLRLDKEDIVFLYFGQIRSYKGVPELIDSFKKLENDRAKLLIAGKPINNEFATNILRLSKDDKRIRNILEFIPDEDIQTYMKAADVVVLPYKKILTSGAIILAISFGKTIIAPAVKCIADTLDNKGSFLYTDNNLFEAMKQIINTDKETLLSMGNYNLMLARKLGWEEIGKKTYDVYRDSLR